MGSWSNKRLDRLGWFGAGLFGLLVALGSLIASCEDSNEEPADQEVTVTEDSSPVGSFSSQAAAAEKASDLAGFEVLPIEALPDGFRVVNFNVVPPVAAGSPVRTVQVLIESSSGGLLITQLSSRAQMGSADPVESPEPGDYFRRKTAEGVLYYTLTDDRTYTLTAHSMDTITDDQAVAVLSRFVKS